MVFQDGSSYRNPKGRWRVPTIFDNLIARGDMPTTIAVFINPGNDPVKNPDAKKPSNRGYEYDGYDRTIDSHIRNLRQKIETDPHAPRLVETVTGAGYRLVDGS